mgnify:CR=1 FL=1
MLVLSRRRNEKIVIGDDITITVLEVRGDQIQLGIQAPRNIPVHRYEVFRAIREVWPEDRPLWLRVSATDWVDGYLARRLGQVSEFGKVFDQRRRAVLDHHEAVVVSTAWKAGGAAAEAGGTGAELSRGNARARRRTCQEYYPRDIRN